MLCQQSFIPPCSKSISFFLLPCSAWRWSSTILHFSLVHTIMAHQVFAGESYPVGLWVPTWAAGRMTSALLLGWTPSACLTILTTVKTYCLKSFLDSWMGCCFSKFGKEVERVFGGSHGCDLLSVNGIRMITIWKGKINRRTSPSFTSSCWSPSSFLVSTSLCEFLVAGRVAAFCFTMLSWRWFWGGMGWDVNVSCTCAHGRCFADAMLVCVGVVLGWGRGQDFTNTSSSPAPLHT